MQSYNFEPACWSADKNGLANINECPLGLLSFDGQNAPELNICSFQGHCYCRRRPIALFDDYCGSRPPLLRIKATGC